jgi:calpain-15
MVETVLKKIDISLTQIEDINKILEKSKIKFIDSEFPPEESSIVGFSDKNLIDDTVNHWRRPSDIYDKHCLIYRMNNNHLIKGKLADNSFYSVVVCLSLANQALLERLFNSNQINPNGIYRLRLCKNGEWQSVTIDDLIPCEPLAKPKFASSSANEIWINLLQKAYAKLHKRYLNLHDL